MDTRRGCMWLWLALTMVSISSARTLLVPDSFPTIEDALYSVCDSDTVLLGPGTYKGPIMSDKNISIIGTSNVTSVLLVPRGKVGISCGPISAVENLRIVGGDVGVRTYNWRARITRNVFVGNRRAAIHAIISCPYIENNTFIKSGVAAIYLESVRCTETRVKNNTIVNARYSGIYLANRTDIRMEHNVVIADRWGVFGSARSTVHADNPNSLLARRPQSDNLGFQLSNTLSTQPEFVSPDIDKPDYRLKPGSVLRKECPLLGVQSE